MFLPIIGIRVKISGRQASRAEAPILVLAPHRSCMDALIVPLIQASPVSREQNKERMFMGTLLTAAQTIFVSRDCQASRLRTKTVIEERAKSGDDWPQIFVCPEGANTEGKVIRKTQSWSLPSRSSCPACLCSSHLL